MNHITYKYRFNPFIQEWEVLEVLEVIEALEHCQRVFKAKTEAEVQRFANGEIMS